MTTAVLIDRLRRKLNAAEAATGLTGCSVPLTLGIPAIDGTLGGGLGRGALHEIAAVRESETAAATGFALALARREVRPTVQPCCGSPRISRSPRTARLTDPASTRPASRPSG